MNQEQPFLDSFKKAVSNLAEALAAPKDELTRDAAIKRFELAFELSWKLLQRYLHDQGLDCQSPKSCFQTGLSSGLIKDEPLVVTMINDRNSSVHTYNETLAEELFSRLPRYQNIFQGLIRALEV